MTPPLPRPPGDRIPPWALTWTHIDLMFSTHEQVPAELLRGGRGRTQREASSQEGLLLHGVGAGRLLKGRRGRWSHLTPSPGQPVAWRPRASATRPARGPETPESGPHHTVRSKTGREGPQGPAERSPREAARESAGFSGPESEARPRPASLAITAMAGPSALHPRAGTKAALSDPGHGEAWATRRPLPGDGAPGWGSALMHKGRAERCPRGGRRRARQAAQGARGRG